MPFRVIFKSSNLSNFRLFPFLKFLPMTTTLAIIWIWNITSKTLIWPPFECNFVHMKCCYRNFFWGANILLIGRLLLLHWQRFLYVEGFYMLKLILETNGSFSNHLQAICQEGIVSSNKNLQPRLKIELKYCIFVVWQTFEEVVRSNLWNTLFSSWPNCEKIIFMINFRL